jgi:imidazolonepropionase
VCTLLPGAALSLRLPFPDARRLLDGGCAVALGTDLNPGSSYTENLPLMMSLACTQMGMTVEEAWRAVTVTAARAVGRPEAGRLQPGARADLVVWNEDDHRALVQRLGMARAERVIVAGRPVLPT